jgi:tetratricopeptide (TPR) repeat protein
MIAQDAEYATKGEDKVRLYREAADIHFSRRQDHAAAAEVLERASEVKPDDRPLLLQLCDCYSASGRGRAAAEVLERVVESYGGKRSKELGDIHRRLADAYIAEGDQERALSELDKAFRIEPGNVYVLKQLGEVALAVGDLKKAQQMFRALLLQRLDHRAPITKAQVFLNLGEVHLRLDERSKAQQMFERALQQDPKLEEAKQRLAELKG